ncbi:MAG: SDR family NAD(P)-dependent oxidoreductase, partial [Anaerolineae bacterium]|nr:SDR family NAD(P)-dependent oxidoreductase [Anaerolineae bacterium]
ARHILLISRRKPSAAVRAKIEQLSANDASIATAQADVAQAAEVERIIAHISETMPPLRGIIHAAGTLDDASLPQQSWDKFQTVMGAKVSGAWHLDQLTRNCPLDFFVMFSSASTLLGTPGQTNYSSANAFMDGLAFSRHARRLPALSINWGAWAEVGMAAHVDARTQSQWQASGIGLIAPDEGVEIFFQLLAQAPTQAGVMPIEWRRLAQQNQEMGKRPFFSQVWPQSTAPTTVKAASNDTLLTDLSQATADEQLEILQAYIQNQVIWVLGLDPNQTTDIHQGLTDMGMDSLMAVELSKRLQAGVGKPLPTTLAFEYPTINALTDYLATDVIFIQSTAAEKAPDKNDDIQEKLLAELEDLSELEAADSLLKELEDAGY